MRANKLWAVVAGAALTLVGGLACSSAAKPAANAHPVPTSTVVAPPSTTESSTSTTAPGLQGSSATSPTSTPGATGAKAAAIKPLSPQDAAALIVGLTDKFKAATVTPNGPHALTQAEAQAIIDAQTKALGIPVTKP